MIILFARFQIPVLSKENSSLDKEKLQFKWWNVLSFPDFSRRFFASLAEKIYTFSLAVLAKFTLSPIPCCSA